MERFPDVPVSSLARPGLPDEVMSLSLSDRAWIAGIFEGEGCIQAQWGRNKTEVSARATVAMTDKDVVLKLHHLTGKYGRFYCYRPPSFKEYWKDQYSWVLIGHRPVRDLFILLEPWLGKRRTAKFEDVIRETAPRGHGQSNKTHCPQGHEYVQANVYLDKNGSRHCRQCQRERGRASYRKRKRREREGAK